MYTEILNILIGFHTCSHISFALTNNYPIYYKTIYYPIFASTDVLVHYYLMKDEQSYISGLWLVWHLIKSIKYFKNLVKDRCQHSYLIYGGDRDGLVHETSMLNYRGSYKAIIIEDW